MKTNSILCSLFRSQITQLRRGLKTRCRWLAIITFVVAWAQAAQSQINLDPSGLGIEIPNPFKKKPKPANARTADVDLPRTLQQAEIRLNNCKPEDKVLWQYITALMHMRAGNYEDARKLFEQALDTVDNRFGKDRSAARARNYLSKEASKTFVGEPYERSMANYYLGILYWMQGGPNQARPCFKNALFEDQYVGDEVYASDYVLCCYLDALGAVKLGQSPDNALEMARSITNTITGPAANPAPLAPLSADANVLVFVEYGLGPLKTSAGDNNEKLVFKAGRPTARYARMEISGAKYELAPSDDVYFQAATRGGRAMDHVNKGKAQFKQGTEVFGATAVTGGIIAAAAGADPRVATGIALAGEGLALFGQAVNPEADTRCWYNLPQYLSFVPLHLSAGRYTLHVEFLDVNRNRVADGLRSIAVDVGTDSKDTLVFVSEFRN